MVNYCCVSGCGRNSRRSKHLYYYTLPKERERQIQWLIAAGREDLLKKSSEKLTYRICSRHFTTSNIKNKHLCADAVPSLCLPGHTLSEDDSNHLTHEDVICNDCNNPIIGFRYRCVTCPDYDLCTKCEMREAHSDHYMLRIPKPVDFKLADDLIQNLNKFFETKHSPSHNYDKSDVNAVSSDDEPITKYARNYDSGIDLSEDVKLKIRNEVSRVLNIKSTNLPNKNKRNSFKKKTDVALAKRKDNFNNRPSKKLKFENDIETETLQEVIFADVNNINTETVAQVQGNVTNTQALPDVSDITDMAMPIPPQAVDPTQPMMHVKLSDDLSMMMIEVTRNDQTTVYKYNN